MNLAGSGSAPLIVAHRGASGESPENTFPAFERAISQRADMIETDLHRTRDGAIVVTHDSDLAGLGGRGEIADATFAQVRALDAGGGERVPVLADLLDSFGARIPFNLEIKTGKRGPYADLPRLVVEEVRGRELLEWTIFSSFDDSVLGALRAESNRAHIGILVSARSPKNWLARAEAVGAMAVHFAARLADEARVAEAHRAGLRVLVYTVDDPDEMARLHEIGVDGFFTNYPARLLARRDKLGRAVPRA